MQYVRRRPALFLLDGVTDSKVDFAVMIYAAMHTLDPVAVADAGGLLVLAFGPFDWASWARDLSRSVVPPASATTIADRRLWSMFRMISDAAEESSADPVAQLATFHEFVWFLIPQNLNGFRRKE